MAAEAHYLVQLAPVGPEADAAQQVAGEQTLLGAHGAQARHRRRPGSDRRRVNAPSAARMTIARRTGPTAVAPLVFYWGAGASTVTPMVTTGS